MNNRMWVPMLFLLALFLSQCTQNPVKFNAEDEIETALEEIDQLDQEIVALHEDDVLDPEPQNPKKRIIIAIHKLDLLIHRVDFIVRRSQNSEADSLLTEAKAAHQEAIASAQGGLIEEAFEWVQKGRYFALEALKIVREERDQNREEIIEALEGKLSELDALLAEVSALLTPETVRAQQLYDRALLHYEAGQQALNEDQLRRAGFHIHEGFWYCHLAMRLLTSSDEDEG